MEKQVAILLPPSTTHLVNVKVPDVAEYEKGLYEYLDNDAAGAAVMDTIRTTGNLDKDTEEQLKSRADPVYRQSVLSRRIKRKEA